MNPTVSSPWFRGAFLVLSGLCLVGALWGGLVRLGWGDFSPLIGGLPGIHGPLIVCGFLGTFFGLERAIAVKNPLAYLGPIMTAAGAIILVAWPSSPVGPRLAVSGSAAFFILCLSIALQKRTLYAFFTFLGSIQWLMGNVMWLLGWPVYNVTLWWMSFVMLTTAGERLELSRMAHLSTGPWIILMGGLGAVFFGHILVAIGHMGGSEEAMDVVMDAIVDPRIIPGMRVAGVGLAVSSLWFIIYDSARKSLGRSGLSGYIAYCMVSSYVWLAVSGAFSWIYAGLVSGATYDAFVHVFFLGFLMSMVMGHAPVLVPAMLGLYLNMRRHWYLGPVLLHLSLLMRVAGDIGPWTFLRKWGGILNSVAIAGCLLTLFYALWADNRPEPRAGEPV